MREMAEIAGRLRRVWCAWTRAVTARVYGTSMRRVWVGLRGVERELADGRRRKHAIGRWDGRRVENVLDGGFGRRMLPVAAVTSAAVHHAGDVRVRMRPVDSAGWRAHATAVTGMTAASAAERRVGAVRRRIRMTPVLAAVASREMVLAGTGDVASLTTGVDVRAVRSAVTAGRHGRSGDGSRSGV
jgi:hypothetical protein